MNNNERTTSSEDKNNKPAEPSGALTASRRKFIGQVGAALAGSVILGKGRSASAQTSDAPINPPAVDTRVRESYNLRVATATQEANIPVPPHNTNGDEQRYRDKSGTYSKGLLQDGIGLVNLHAFEVMKRAIRSGSFQEWQTLILGGTRTENGPMGSYAYQLEGTDPIQFGSAPSPANQISQIVVPPAPALASETYGTELVEMYWASLLRDVPFDQYSSNPTAQAAAAELSSMPHYLGPRDSSGNVTPDLLFRGTYPGCTVGPYISQFMIQPTFMGAQPISQQMLKYVAGVDYMTDPITYQQVQNGISTGQSLQIDPILRYIFDGRGLGTFPHLDVLFQGYFTAYLLMSTLGVPLNPGNPYVGSSTQNGFGTFGDPDAAGTVTAVGRTAVNNVWYQKWLVHLRHRPESGGAIARQILKGFGNTLMGHVNDNVLNSQAIQASFDKFGDYFLAQAYPEGSPTHPSYPTGHGTVAGACITALKFFYDGDFVIQNPMVPSDDGLSLVPYTGGDTLTVNGELNKVATNVSFGHGIHAGIHWRTDTTSSIQLGEALALSILQDRARTYREPFTINITKIDGTVATISNQ